MPLPRLYCVSCGNHVDEVGPVSTRGYCQECAATRMVDNIVQLRAHSGPRFQYWRNRLAASVGAELPGGREQLEEE